MSPIGRGALTIDPEDVISDPYEDIKHIPCPHSISEPALTPNGHLVACCGFELSHHEFLDFGSVRERSAGSLIAEANDNLIAIALAELGPGFLLDILKKQAGLKPRDSYSGICDMCFHAIGDRRNIELLAENAELIAACISAKRSRENANGRPSVERQP